MTATVLTATALARPNIALVKYWGKRDARLNLPAAGSLSITLDSLVTRTTVRFDASLAQDRLWLNGEANGRELQRISACLDLLRGEAGTTCRAEVTTTNNFPTAAGLASSASGFAALVLAAAQALQLPLTRTRLSAYARQGSGSAARSLFGGFVRMQAGQLVDGSDAVAAPLLSAADWPLKVLVAVTSRARKPVQSGAGMEQTRLTSPYHAAWVASVAEDLDHAEAAIHARDFMRLAEVSEHSCLKMHADMLATQPPLIYWSAATLAAIHCVRELRERDGVPVFFTVDAGPQVKAVCLPAAAAQVKAALAAVPGVVEVLETGLGEGAEIVPETGA